MKGTKSTLSNKDNMGSQNWKEDYRLQERFVQDSAPFLWNSSRSAHLCWLHSQAGFLYGAIPGLHPHNTTPGKTDQQYKSPFCYYFNETLRKAMILHSQH